MPPSDMAPPPSPLAHRRTRACQSSTSPTSLQSFNDQTCLLRKMGLSKGATFHVPSSPPSEHDPVLSIAHLARRSPTSSGSSLMSLILDKEDVAARSIEDFMTTFSGARGKCLTNRRGYNHSDHRLRTYSNNSAPSDEGLGTSISSPSEKGLSSSFERALDLEKDSALGTSVSGGSMKQRQARPGVSVLDSPEESDHLVEDLVQEIEFPVASERPVRQRGSHTYIPVTSISRSAVTHSISPHPNTSSTRQPHLTSLARKTLAKTVFHPILREARFEFFHPLVNSLASKSNKSIKCLRDLEQSLIFEPLRFAVPRNLYRTFGEFSIQLVIDTYHHLSEPEQRRFTDRPYDNGYFLDLVQQVGRLAAQIGSAAQARATELDAETAEADEMAYSTDDEVTLEGGLGDTGEIAELVRWKNGKGISLRTNEPYEPLPGIKRQHSNESLDDDVARSMARRKKGVEPKIVELKCSDKGCDKTFNRKCDLAKHEKTHTRPFKCPEASCRYHEQGLPTEKERDRHVNDRHSSNPHYFRCEYCSFKTKRDSNCKQHMEKQHGWQYDRIKGNGRFMRTPGQTPQTPNMEYSPVEKSPAPTHSGWSGSSASGSVAGSNMVTPLEPSIPDFNTYTPGPQQTYALFPRESPQSVRPQSGTIFAQSSPQQVLHAERTMNYHASPVTPQVTSPVTPADSGAYSYGQSPYMNYAIDINFNDPTGYNTGFPTPVSNYLQPTSRNPSISYQSPLAQDNMEQFFPVPPANLDGLNRADFTSHGVVPADDFTLFDQTNHRTQFPSTADASSAGGGLFPDMSQMEFCYGDDEGQNFDDFLNVNEMLN